MRGSVKPNITGSLSAAGRVYNLFSTEHGAAVRRRGGLKCTFLHPLNTVVTVLSLHSLWLLVLFDVLLHCVWQLICAQVVVYLCALWEEACPNKDQKSPLACLQLVITLAGWWLLSACGYVGGRHVNFTPLLPKKKKEQGFGFDLSCGWSFLFW